MLCSAHGMNENVDPSKKFAATDTFVNAHEQGVSPLMVFGGEHEKKSSEEKNQHDQNNASPNNPHRRDAADLEENASDLAQRGDIVNSVNGIQELEKKREEEKEEKISALQIEDFRAAVEAYPEAGRLIINNENKIIPQEEDPNTPGANRSANKKILEALQALLQAEYGEELVKNLNVLSAQRTGTIIYNYLPLSAATVAEILGSLPLVPSKEQLGSEFDGGELDDIEFHFAATTIASPDSIFSDFNSDSDFNSNSIFNRPAFLKEKEETGKFIQQLVRERFKNQIANYHTTHSDHYAEADTAWDDQLESWEARTRARREKQDAIALRERAEQLLKAAQAAQKNPDETFLGKVAEYTGKAAVPLSYIPGPIPLGGIAHTIAEIAEKINQMRIQFDEKVAKVAVQLTKQNETQIFKKAQQTDENFDNASKQAEEQEKNARLQENIIRREIVTTLQPPIMRFEEKAWRTWAEKLLPSSEATHDHENLITQIFEYGMSDPAWAADVVHAAWDWKSVSHHQQEEKKQFQASLKPLESSLEEAQKALKGAEEAQKKAKEKVDDLKYKHQLATEDHQKAKGKLDAKETLPTEFAESFKKLQKACACINNFNDQLQEALNELAQAEEKKNLCNDHLDFAQNKLLRAQERIAAVEEHPLKSKLPFRFPNKTSIHVLTIEQLEQLEQQQPEERREPQNMKPPSMLQKVAEFLGRKLYEELEGTTKNSSNISATLQMDYAFPLLINPTAADHGRWEAMEKMEVAAQEQEKVAHLYQQSMNQNPSATIPNKAGLKMIAEEEKSEGSNDSYQTAEEEFMGDFNNRNDAALSNAKQISTSSRSRTASLSSLSSYDSFVSAKSHFSRKSFSERMQRDSRCSDSDRSSVFSAKTAKTFRSSGAQSVRSNRSTSSQRKLPTSQNLKADLAKAEHLFQQEKEKWIKKIEGEAKRDGISFPIDSKLREAFLEEKKKVDVRNYTAWKEQREIAANALGVMHQLKNWEANTTRWEARWEADESHAEVKNLEKIFNPDEEEYQLAEKRAKEAEAKWVSLANLEESVQNQPDEEQKKLAREKLEEQDRAITIFWEDFQEGNSNGKYLKRSQRAEKQQADKKGEDYEYDLLLEIKKTMADCFMEADTAEVVARKAYGTYLRTRDQKNYKEAQHLYQLADEAENRARTTYAKIMREKALQDALEKTPGALEAWQYLLNKALEEEATTLSQVATSPLPQEDRWANEVEHKAKRSEFLVQADREALRIFKKADRDFNEIEKIWLAQWGHEKEARRIHRWRAVKNYFDGHENLWNKLSSHERELHNGEVDDANLKYQDTLLQILNPLNKQLNSIQHKINQVVFFPYENDMEKAEAAEKALREAMQHIGKKLALSRWSQLQPAEHTHELLQSMSDHESNELEFKRWQELTSQERQAEMRRLQFKFEKDESRFKSNAKKARQAGEEKEATSWDQAGYGASWAAEYLKKSIEAEKSNKLEEAAKWREASNYQQQRCENNTKAALAWTAGKEKEATSWDYAGAGANWAATYLKKSIEAENNKKLEEAAKWREASNYEQQRCENETKTALAWAAGKEKEAISWDEAGAGANWAAEYLKKSIEAENNKKPEEAAKWREASNYQQQRCEKKTKAALAWASGKEKEATTWNQAGYGANWAAEYLKESIKAENNNDLEEAAKWREGSNYWQQWGENKTKAAEAWAAGKEKEATSWNEAALVQFKLLDSLNLCDYERPFGISAK